MNTLNFGLTNRTFTFTTDEVRITGSVGYEEEVLQNLNGSIELLNSGFSNPAGTFYMRLDIEEPSVDIHNVVFANLVKFCAAINSCYEAIIEELNLNLPKSEQLAEE